MAIDRTPLYKRCRYLGIDPGSIGYASAQTAPSRPLRARPSAYALQLKEKQKVKFIYGVLERQFRRAFGKASRLSGKTGETLLQLMESRLDNAVYRLAWAKTRREARQIVGHGKVRVNGRKADIPSLEVKPGDILTLKPDQSASSKSRYLALGRAVPNWLSFDLDSMTAAVVKAPERSSIDYEIREHLIVELYSK